VIQFFALPLVAALGSCLIASGPAASFDAHAHEATALQPHLERPATALPEVAEAAAQLQLCSRNVGSIVKVQVASGRVSPWLAPAVRPRPVTGLRASGHRERLPLHVRSLPPPR